MISLYLFVIFSLLFLIFFLFLFFRHQRGLRQRAHLMREAIRNHDWTFNLSTRGLTSGERAMQDALNDLGQVIRQQVSQSEVESWERLMRVLTHEIMNSTAPIASISQSLLRRVDVQGTALEAGIRSIHSTASRLTTFVDSYRKLSQLQQPVPQNIRLATFIGEIQNLFPNLTWDISGFDEQTIYADPALLQQVVVNLVKNAVEAGSTKIKVETSPVHVFPTALFFSNNGAPIPAEVRDTIFVPFFTTKNNGTGIGLSLSRQILARQGGMLELMEQPRTGYTTSFCLSLPNGLK
ncbi:MAG: HAMP domain-containing histidine kinase [Bacteroidaceae bacterium]|nr:HAMP domain-containing histidine kinase [Bacteroidaceae bacterium]